MGIVQEQNKPGSSALEDSEFPLACSSYPGRRAWHQSWHGLETLPGGQVGCGCSALRFSELYLYRCDQTVPAGIQATCGPWRSLFHQNIPSQWHDLFSESFWKILIYVWNWKSWLISALYNWLVIVLWVIFFLNWNFTIQAFLLHYVNLTLSCQTVVQIHSSSFFVWEVSLELTICIAVTSKKLKPFIIFTRKHQQLFSVSGVATDLHCYLKLDHEGEISACHLLSYVFLFWRACSLLLEVNSPDLGRVLGILLYVSVGLWSKYSVIQRYTETKIPIFWLYFFQFLFRYFLSPARWSTTELESVGVELWFCFWEFYQRNMDSTWLRLTSITKQGWPKMNRQVSS